VNRSFYAFGILLTLLVLATLGVSSSSRSTQVRLVPVKASKKHPQARRCGSGTFVIVLPETQQAAQSRQFPPARIELAGEVAGLAWTLDPMDCRSHADPAYDAAVYGDLPAVTSSMAMAEVTADRSSLEAEELVGIFRALAEIDPQSRMRTSTTRFRWLAGHSRPIFLGLKNWSIRQVERMPLAWLVVRIADRGAAATPSITWFDYSNFADSVISSSCSPQSAKEELVADGHVQSGHWLLHSAASSLNHLALVLQAAADRLHHRAEPGSAE